MHLSALPPLRVLVAGTVLACCASSASVAAQPRDSAQPRDGAQQKDSASQSTPAQQARVQAIVDNLAARLGISDAVHVSIVPANPLLMSVEPGPHAFELKAEDGWSDALDDAELAAAVAHELGHVWIFTHHPFLHTEQLANETAMRVVSRDVLARLYDKVWKRRGVTGDLARYLGPEVSRGLASPEAEPAQAPAPAPAPAPVEFEVVSIKRSAA